MSKEKKKEKRLTTKEKLFCDRYLFEPTAKFNGTEAARGVYDTDNDKSLAEIAYQNLRKLHIKAYIDDILSSMCMSANEVITRLNNIARGKVTDFINSSGNFDLNKAKKAGKDDILKKLKQKRTIKQTKTEVRDDMRTFLAEDEIEPIESNVEIIYEETEFEIYSAHDALRDLGRYHKLFTDKTELTGKDGAPIETSTTHDISKLSLDKLKILKEILLESKK